MEKNTSETLYSLKFAERVRSVELGPVSRRAELGSWSSQEHLEVRGQHRPEWERNLGWHGQGEEEELTGEVTGFGPGEATRRN